MACSRPIQVASGNLMSYKVPGVRMEQVPSGFYKVNPIGPDSVYIPVGCGVCPDCLRLRQIYCVQRAQMEVFAGCDLFFFTLTVQNSMMQRVRIGDKVYKYADYRDVALMMKRIKKDNLFGFDFEFMVVREMGGEKGRHHFHGIISMIPPENNERKSIKISRALDVHRVLLNEWRRNISGSSRWPVWKPMCRYIVDSRGCRTFDCHYVDPALTPNSEGDVAFYITKYCLKPNKKVEKLRSFLKMNLPQDYCDHWKHLSPRVWYSRKFGTRYDSAFEKHIRKGIDFAIREKMCGPVFFNPLSGQTFPLHPLYRKKFLTYSDKCSFYYLGQEPDEKKLYEIFLDDERHERVRQRVDKMDMIDFFPEDI